MSLNWIDWLVICTFLFFFFMVAYYSKRYTRSAADFLAANRCAGRYLLTLSEGMAGVGAVTIIAGFQVYYTAGLGASWWRDIAMPLYLLMTLSGWVIYRFRETRALTLGQFLEMRYSRKFRIFAGLICYLSGIITFGIFPAVGANFFISFCGLPSSYGMLGLGFSVSTYHTLLFLIIVASLYFTFTGGQVTVLVTDFVQSFFCNIVLLIILLVLLVKFPLNNIFEGLMISDEGKSMVNPFGASKIQGFSPWFFIIAVVGSFYNRLAWQGSQAYNSSATSPHEAKMAGVLQTFRGWVFGVTLSLIPIVAYAIMHHPFYSDIAAKVTEVLSKVENEAIRDQLLVPTTMKFYLPVGLMGAFTVVMAAALLSTHDTYLHSWGSIFVQDIVIPLRKKAFPPKQHLLILRLSTIFVAVFIFVFSSVFRQTQYLAMFMAVTASIWLGGAGAVIIGGLYTRWGTVAGAYAGLAIGSVISFTGMICQHNWERWCDKEFFFSGQEVFFLAIISSMASYILFSLLAKNRRKFNLDKMLHRGQYRNISDHATKETVNSANTWNWKQLLGLTKEFSIGDKIIYGLSMCKAALFFILFIVMTFLGTFLGLSELAWANFHRYLLVFGAFASILIVIWLSIGGIRDLIRLFKGLKTSRQDENDDGSVFEHNSCESTEADL